MVDMRDIGWRAGAADIRRWLLIFGAGSKACVMEVYILEDEEAWVATSRWYGPTCYSNTWPGVGHGSHDREVFFDKDPDSEETL